MGLTFRNKIQKIGSKFRKIQKIRPKFRKSSKNEIEM